jgi:hypothetical protein
MLMRTRLPGRGLANSALAALAILIAIPPAASAATRQGQASGAPVAAVADDGIPGKGQPPAPGPTDPSAPAR